MVLMSHGSTLDDRGRDSGEIKKECPVDPSDLKRVAGMHALPAEMSKTKEGPIGNT